LQNAFEVDTNPSGYAMGVVLMQGGYVFYHFENVHWEFLNYPTYDKEIYSMVQAVKKWMHYLMGKETIIHIDDQLLQYLQGQSNLQQTRHYKWMGFLQ
jgi:hypothetical protein